MHGVPKLPRKCDPSYSQECRCHINSGCDSNGKKRLFLHSCSAPLDLPPPHFLNPSPQGSQLESLFTLPSNQSESRYLALSQGKTLKPTILTKHRSHASRIPSSNQSSSCHSEERKTPLSSCLSSKT
ncbi:uncharacterized protein TNCV_2729911 [Trichonephila clavipes]|nr:uncharacterized protein TNCV_2729911 [Trichonephila clavipes]